MSASEPYRTLPRAKKLSIIKLSQARELLASGLGHNTYASLRKADLATLELARYVILDIERRLRRAADLLLPLTLDQWWTVHRELASGRITGGCYLGEAAVMESAARHLVGTSERSLQTELDRSI